ncbi:MAG: hypothetical protein [Caudoviricetes sp.]|nr:MAG: hypothetical protein [Caudoviricetes sp.]
MKKRFKKYGVYVAIAIFGGILGTALSLTIWHQNNIGTLADWVSGFASMGAIVFAYLQIREQKNEYEEDKTLANRSFFSIVEQTQLKDGKDHLWLADEDCQSNPNKVLEKTTPDYTYFKGGFFAYKLKNVSQALATDVVLKIEYQNKLTGNVIRTEYCNLRTCVGANEQAIILPHSIMNNPETYSLCPKKIYLYFKAIDNTTYCQKWIEKRTKYGLCAEDAGFEKTPIEKMTSQAVYTRAYIPLDSLTNKDT